MKMYADTTGRRTAQILADVGRAGVGRRCGRAAGAWSTTPPCSCSVRRSGWRAPAAASARPCRTPAAPCARCRWSARTCRAPSSGPPAPVRRSGTPATSSASRWATSRRCSGWSRRSSRSSWWPASGWCCGCGSSGAPPPRSGSSTPPPTSTCSRCEPWPPADAPAGAGRDDPAGAWRAQDPDVVRALALLELRDSGLRPPPAQAPAA